MIAINQNQSTLVDLLIKHEGLRLLPYTDTTGHLTIGIGRNLSDRGIIQSEAMNLLNNDIDYFTHKLTETLSYFNVLDEARKIVLVDMCFNLGLKGLLAFKRMLASVEKNDWVTAAYEIQRSKAAKQAPNRYKELADIMRTGRINLRVN